MTADKLQDLARVLSNCSWCRYWLNLHDSHYVIMAIQCRNESGQPLPIHDAERHGLKVGPDFLYTVRRTNKDGSEYQSSLF